MHDFAAFMRRVILGVFMALLASYGDACWYQSKKNAFKKIVKFLEQHGMDGQPWDRTVGVTRLCLEHVVEDSPSAVEWLVNKVHGVDGVFADCDTNGDGLIFIEEAYKNPHCAGSCWKQIGIETFLN